MAPSPKLQARKGKTSLRSAQDLAWARMGAAVEARGEAARRSAAVAVACACALACAAALALHQRSAARQHAQGSAAAQAAADAAMAVLSMRDPNVGFARIAGRVFESSTEWGASLRAGAVPDGSGAEVEVAFSSRAQCVAAMLSGQPRFELAFVDAKPAPDPESACRELGQNALRWVKLDPRDKQAPSQLSAGAYDPIRGGFIPGRARPATPSSGSAPAAPPQP